MMAYLLPWWAWLLFSGTLWTIEAIISPNSTSIRDRTMRLFLLGGSLVGFVLAILSFFKVRQP